MSGKVIYFSPSLWSNFFSNIGYIILTLVLIAPFFNEGFNSAIINIVNFPFDLLGAQYRPAEYLLPLFLSFPLLMVIYSAYYTFTNVFEVDDTRLIHSYGVFSRTIDEVELYRIKDYTISQNLFMRLVGIYNLKLVTSDKSQPILLIKGIAHGTLISNLIRERVERIREEKGVREFD